MNNRSEDTSAAIPVRVALLGLGHSLTLISSSDLEWGSAIQRRMRHKLMPGCRAHSYAQLKFVRSPRRRFVLNHPRSDCDVSTFEAPGKNLLSVTESVEVSEDAV